MSKPISQREARRLRKRVDELEEQESIRARVWSSDWPGGVHLFSLQLEREPAAIIRTAAKLGHYIVVKIADGGVARYYASKVKA